MFENKQEPAYSLFSEENYVDMSRSAVRARELEVCEKIISQHFIRKDHIAFDIINNQILFDALAADNEHLKLFFLHPVVLWVEETIQYKHYEEIAAKLRANYGAIDVVRDGTSYCGFSTIIEDVRGASVLSEFLSKLRHIFIEYRGKTYKYSAFKQSLYKYVRGEVVKPEDYLALQDSHK